MAAQPAVTVLSLSAPTVVSLPAGTPMDLTDDAAGRQFSLDDDVDVLPVHAVSAVGSLHVPGDRLDFALGTRGGEGGPPLVLDVGRRPRLSCRPRGTRRARRPTSCDARVARDRTGWCGRARERHRSHRWTSAIGDHPRCLARSVESRRRGPLPVASHRDRRGVRRARSGAERAHERGDRATPGATRWRSLRPARRAPAAARSGPSHRRHRRVARRRAGSSRAPRHRGRR